jgi:hypothetical protein
MATSSDAQGAFVLEGLAPGPRSLLVSAQGYNGRIVSGIDTTGGDATNVNVDLTPTPPGHDPQIELVGIGAMLSMRHDALVITGLMTGGGAAAAGLVPGDQIATIDGTDVATLGFEGSVEHIRGPEGTSVTLGVQRGDAGVTQVPVRRLRLQAQ